MKIVEGMFYTYPHKPELVGTHPVMGEVWRKCIALLGEDGVMAPLLVDDRRQRGAITRQTVEGVLNHTTGKGYESFPWIASQVSEAQLEARHKTCECSTLYLEYHILVMWYLQFLSVHWTWTKVHPVYFQETNAKTLESLIKRMPGDDRARSFFLSRFDHFWVEKDGGVIHTRPVWKNGEVKHEPILDHDFAFSVEY